MYLAVSEDFPLFVHFGIRLYRRYFGNFPLFVNFETRLYRRSREQRCDSRYFPRRCIRERSEREVLNNCCTLSQVFCFLVFLS